MIVGAFIMAGMKQEQLDVWLTVKYSIRRNSRSRINWRAIFGVSLSRHIALMRFRGLTPDEIISDAVCRYGLLAEAERRLRISVCARFAEYGMVKNVEGRL